MAGGTLGGKAERYPSRPDAMKFADSLRTGKKAKVIHRDFSFSPSLQWFGRVQGPPAIGSKSAYQGCQRQAAPNIAEPGCDLEQGPTRVVNLSRYAKERSTAMKWRSARRAQGRKRLGNEFIDRVAENAAESCIYPEPAAVATACDSDCRVFERRSQPASLLRINPSWICWSARRASASIRAEIAVDFSVNALSTSRTKRLYPQSRNGRIDFYCRQVYRACQFQ
jgi:hypothetical protein